MPAGYVIPPGRVQFTTVPYAGLAQHVADLPVRMVILTGTTAAAEGDFTSVAHGLDATKILSIDNNIELLYPGHGDVMSWSYFINNRNIFFTIKT